MRSLPDAAPNGANQRRSTNHSTNGTAVRTTDEGDLAWMLYSAVNNTDIDNATLRR
jgi:hypothetical protein